MSNCTCGSNWTDEFCERHGRKAGLCRDCDAFKAELARLQKGKASNDADYLRQSAEISRLRDERDQLKQDRRAFAEETQKYRDAWLEDRDTIARYKKALEERGSGNSAVTSPPGSPASSQPQQGLVCPESYEAGND